MSQIYFIIVSFFLCLLFLPQQVFAEMTPYRSAGWVATNATSSNPYANLTGCQLTDGIYCEHPSAPGGMNIYFSSFGSLSDFGISQGSTINKVHFRITGKNNVTQWIQVDEHRNKPLTNLCQSPFDLWQVYLGPSDSVKEFHTDFNSSNFLFNCFSPARIDAQNFTIALFVNGYNTGSWYSSIDNFEIAFDYTPAPSPTPTNIPTPTITPTPKPIPSPEPFLDLPWKYKGDFEDAALEMSSFFDHEYPLLSSGLSEPNEGLETTVNFRGFPRVDKPYSSHDGYDYARLAHVLLGDSVNAAAGGTARYVTSCTACGNAIFIDHGNGYQTRYYHLQKEGLITTNPDEVIHVVAGQIIGKVGFTGNVDPKGEEGAHIHFMVIEDKNKDGNFEDNIPDGLTDPFGWQSTSPDPWENYAFVYAGKQRTGNKSYYLWTKKIPELKASLPANGGIFRAGDVKVEFPTDSTRPDLLLDMHASPVVNASSELVGVGPAIDIVAKNLVGDLVTFFAGAITIKIDFSDVDLSRFATGNTTFSIYSSNDGEHWNKESTVIDMTTKTATTQVNHLTQFSLMAERSDTVAPTTSANFSGKKGRDSWFRSAVQLVLSAKDNTGGLGVDYMLYKIEEGEWQIYEGPINFTTQGMHKVSFYSVDKDGNAEEVKAATFTIDQTSPEAKIMYDVAKQDLLITGIDTASSTNVVIKELTKVQQKIVVSDLAGNTLTLHVRDRDHGNKSKINIFSLQYNDLPLVEFGDNKFLVTYNLDEKKNKVKEFEQEWLIKGDSKILLDYSAKENRTTITKKIVGEKRVKTVENGIKLLQLVTQNGTLKYSY